MATPYAVPAVADRADAREPPKLSVLRVVAMAGLLLAACSLALDLTSDDFSAVRFVLLEWISVPYIVAGLLAWWRRPDSHLGVLMIAGGFATGLSVLELAPFAALHTVGLIFDIVLAVLFLHVYLAFPHGRLRSGSSEDSLLRGTWRRSVCNSPRWRLAASGLTICWRSPRRRAQRKLSNGFSFFRSARSVWPASPSWRRGGDMPAGRFVDRWHCWSTRLPWVS